jgi:dipeptidyl aminopeptidase/acylaminoacyl peptidase
MPKPISPETLVYGFTSAGEPQVSPDGKTVAYSLSSTDATTKKGSSQVWLCGIDGGNPRQLTSTGQRNRGARWSPDGSLLAFVSDRVEKSGVFVLPMAGGEARELTRMNQQIGDLAWSVDGTRLAFTALYDPDNPEGDKRPEGSAPPVRVTSRIDYKQDNRGYLNDARAQVFVADVTSGERKMITTDALDKAFPAWSPDGRWLAVKVLTVNGMCSHLRLVPASGEGAAKTLGWEPGTVGTFAFSRDGGRLVFTGEPTHIFQPEFYVYDLASGETRQVTTDLEVLPVAGFPTLEPPSQPAWLDDRHVLFHAVRAGASGLCVVDLENGRVELVEGSRSLRSGMSTDTAVRYVAQAWSSLEGAGEITVFDRGQGTSNLITHYCEPVLQESPPAGWERFDVRRDGYITEAWLLKPADFDPAKKYPLILDVHGGPNGFYGYGFSPMQQCLATNGFLVVYSNPRGSTSYGREFAQQVLCDWGGEDYRDLMAVVDAALERPYVDRERTGIWGYSYGGYMTAWTIAQNHRFKAAVCGAPCFDLESMYGTSDISHFFGELQWGGAPHEAREWYATHSPSQFAHNTRTPTLIIQGEADDRCPVGQGEQMYVALKKAGCEVEFVRYPGASHLFMRAGPAEHRQDALERVLGWFNGHLRSDER